MLVKDTRKIVEKALVDGNGILRLEPAWVARDFLPPGKRLGLPEDRYDVGERGFICERWLASTTRADNRIHLPDEGLSYLAIDGAERVTLDEAIQVDPVGVMGAAYAASHQGLGRLAKIFDYSARLPYHLHQRQRDADRVGRTSKDEAYYFPPDVDMGPHPETFFGVHPYIVEEKKYDLLLPHLEQWNSDLILKHSRAYLQVAEEGFFLPSGHLHAPGTAVTIELQEASDVFSMMQAMNAGKVISKELLWKDVHPDDRKRYGERFILGLVDWPENGNPYFYEDHHLSQQPVPGSVQPGGVEYWIYYNTLKFSGKKLVVKPGGSYMTVDKGVYNLLVWRGRGDFGGITIEGGKPEMDELLVTHDKATGGILVKNTGKEDLMILKFFGPDVNPDVPMITRRWAPESQEKQR